jgi:hypothetical protein
VVFGWVYNYYVYFDFLIGITTISALEVWVVEDFGFE